MSRPAELHVWDRSLGWLGGLSAVGLGLLLFARLSLRQGARGAEVQAAVAVTLALSALAAATLPWGLWRQRRRWRQLLAGAPPPPVRRWVDLLLALPGLAAGLALAAWAFPMARGLFVEPGAARADGWPAAEAEAAVVLLSLSVAAALFVGGLGRWLSTQPRALAALAPETSGKTAEERGAWVRRARRSGLCMFAGLWTGVGSLCVLALGRYLDLQRYFSAAHALATTLCLLCLAAAVWSAALGMLYLRTMALQCALAGQAAGRHAGTAPDGAGVRRSATLVWMLARVFTGLAGLATLAAALLELCVGSGDTIDTRLWLCVAGGSLLVALPLLAVTGRLRQQGLWLVAHAEGPALGRAGPGPEEAAPGRGERRLARSLPWLFGLVLLPLCAGFAHGPSRLRMLAGLVGSLGRAGWAGDWTGWLATDLCYAVDQMPDPDPALLADVVASARFPRRNARRDLLVEVMIRGVGQECCRELPPAALVEALPRCVSAQGSAILVHWRLDRNEEPSAVELDTILRAICAAGADVQSLAHRLFVPRDDGRGAILRGLREEYERAGSRPELMTALLLLAHWGDKEAFSELFARRAEFDGFSLVQCLAEGIVSRWTHHGRGGLDVDPAAFREALAAEAGHALYPRALRNLQTVPALAAHLAPTAGQGDDGRP